jgi:sugar phosphate isomerase/epimerase
MSLSTLPLSYCTNVHPGLTVEEVVAGLERITLPVQERLGRGIAAGLWLAAPVATQLRQAPAQLEKLRNFLRSRELPCYTLNAFPYGNFHSERVKEQVYLPDWSDPRRLDYTLDCARILAAILPDGVQGSISTMPLAFKEQSVPADFREQCIQQLLTAAIALDELHDETGRVIRLAIEPEPCCVLETTAETIQFFVELFQSAGQRGLEQIARSHLGVCYDVCHQAVEFEDVTASIQQLQAAGIRINKVHITCAIELKHPGEHPAGLAALAAFAEPRYLHQTFALLPEGPELLQTDLTAALCHETPEKFLKASAWRIHFHVPVHAPEIPQLGSTRSELEQALAAVAQLDYAPHLEVETYTWSVLPGAAATDLTAGLTDEMQSALELIDRLRMNSNSTK